MIRITKGNTPSKLESPRCRNRVEQNVQNQEFKGSYYNHKTVLQELENIHHGKCSFCETKIRPVDTPQVEHYRPKNQLKDDPAHTGYYWLGHEWNNLLLACPACNKAKSSYFPILGNRVTAPGLLPDGKLDRNRCQPDMPPLFEEQPLLINPEFDDPEQHFRFHPDGRIEGLTIRGRESIKRCNLDRKSLDLDRKKVLDDYITELDEKFVGYMLGMLTDEDLEYFIKKTVQKIKMEVKAEMKYTFFRKYAFEQFEDFFVSQVEDARKDDLRHAYQIV